MFVLNTAFIMCVISSSFQKPDTIPTRFVLNKVQACCWNTLSMTEDVEGRSAGLSLYVRDFKLPCVEKDSIVFIGISSVFGAFRHF